jgi:signal transduction histidine kinase
VLSALLAAGSTQADPASLVLSARGALDIVSDSRHRPDPGSRVVTFTRVVQAMEREFAPMRDQVQLDLAAARDVELPIVVAETLVSATLQALANSIAHAGAATCRMVVASRTADGGIRISIEDDGRGFDLDRIAPERLGVRISIIERMRLIGGDAEIRSAPGEGTVVVLRWSRRRSDAPADARTAVRA